MNACADHIADSKVNQEDMHPPRQDLATTAHQKNTVIVSTIELLYVPLYSTR